MTLWPIRLHQPLILGHCEVHYFTGICLTYTYHVSIVCGMNVSTLMHVNNVPSSSSMDVIYVRVCTYKVEKIPYKLLCT